MTRYGLPIIAALLLVFAASSVLRSRPSNARDLPPSPPPQANFAAEIGGVGLVEPSSEIIAISTPVPGLVTSVYVKAGDRVKRGQPLFSLDDRDLQAEAKLRRAALEVAKTQLEKLEKSPRPEEIPPAEARVRAAEVALADANVQLRIIESVTDRRAIREEDLQRRRLASKSAQAKLDEERASLALLKAGAWSADLQVSRAQVVQAEQQIRRIEADIERLTITAPIDGEILQCKVRAGEFAQSGQLPTPLMQMGAADRLHLRVDIDEQEALKVRAGAKAVASPRGNGSVRLPIEFVRFEPYVIPKKSLTGDATERVDTRVLQVIYAFAPGAKAYNGQQMDVYIEAAK